MEKEIYLKLANAAESLANDLENGVGPHLGIYRLFTLNGEMPCCALGHVMTRAGFNDEESCRLFVQGFRAAELVKTNDSSNEQDRSKNVIKPLRNLAEGWRKFYERQS
jgi:hypothetical protein